MAKYLYYPGCSQKASSRPYEKAFLAVCSKLGVELEEIDDWNCCGATMAVSCNKLLSLCLPARNLARAEALDLPVVTPCPSCWLSFKRVNKVFQDDRPLAEQVQGALSEANATYQGTAVVRHALDFFLNEVGLEAIRQKVSAPLKGVKIAPYYGCQIVRPYGEGADAQNPQGLERIIHALGGESVDFPHRTSCCGSSLMATSKAIADGLCLRILDSIVKAGADVTVTPCGLCQVNLELAQRSSRSVLKRPMSMGVLNLAQLVGLALGLTPSDLGVVGAPLGGKKTRMNTAERVGVTSVN